MELQDLIKFFGHCMKARFWQLVVIVVMANWFPIQVLGERPESIEFDVLAQFHGGASYHESSGEPIGPHPPPPPKLSQAFKIIGMEKNSSLLCLVFLQ